MTISSPGIYPDIASADYYADPCPTPSLTQSLAKVLIERSPLHAWHQHPRLNPDYRERDGREPWLDIGNIAHQLLLGRGKSIVVLDYDDWRTKAAKEAREAAAEKGQLAVLAKHHGRANRMVEAAREQLILRGIGDLFGSDGDAECCLAWKEDNLWFRQLLDWINAGRSAIADYKTTESAPPHALSRKLFDGGWHIQAAMAERGLDALDMHVGRREYLFVCQETEPPYQLTVTNIGEAALTMGRKMLDFAVNQWRECMAENRFPGYPINIEHPDFPMWAEAEWLNREVEHAERKQFDPDMLRV